MASQLKTLINQQVAAGEPYSSVEAAVEILADAASGQGAGGPVAVKPVCFRTTATFTRPSDTNAYAQYDAISTSTSAPAILPLAIPGAAAGDFVDIRNVRVNTSSKPTGTKLTANVFLAKQTFAATNDNAELSVDDTTAAGGAWVSLYNQFQTALNFRVSSDPVQMLVQLESANLYAALQANNAWAPGNADVITLTVEGFLYKA